MKQSLLHFSISARRNDPIEEPEPDHEPAPIEEPANPDDPGPAEDPEEQPVEGIVSVKSPFTPGKDPIFF
jgi:hypothetical protein